MYRDTKIRSLAKAVSNRAFNTTATIFIVLFFASDDKTLLSIIAGAGLADIVIKFILFYINERIWDKLQFGREKYTPAVVWFTGLPYAGKRLMADKLFEYLQKKKLNAERLDGDDVRTLFPLRGFTREERNAYLMRMGFLSKLLAKNGVFVIASFISPYEKSREYNRRIIENYIEVYVATPQEVCEKWDVWGSYERARKSEISNFVGVDEKYEAPKNPEVIIDLSTENQADALAKILAVLKKNYL